MITKFLDIFSAARTFDDRCASTTNEQDRKKATWLQFVKVMQNCYKPTENLTWKKCQFCSITQKTSKVFVAFCNGTRKETKHSNFERKSRDCTSEIVAVRDQVIIGTTNEKIREGAIKNSWDLQKRKREGMHFESAVHGIAEL